MKNVYQKETEFLRVFYKKKEKNPFDFFIDEIDVDSYLFHNFLNVCLFRETYSIKEFTFDLHIAYQSFKLTAELHLTMKEILLILENLKLTKKSYDNISKTLFTPKFVKNPEQSSLFLHSVRIFKVFLNICFEQFTNFELSSQIYIKIKELDYLNKKISIFSLITFTKFNYLHEKIAEMLL